jgi:hypothetical protein
MIWYQSTPSAITAELPRNNIHVTTFSFAGHCWYEWSMHRSFKSILAGGDISRFNDDYPYATQDDAKRAAIREYKKVYKEAL